METPGPTSHGGTVSSRPLPPPAERAAGGLAPLFASPPHRLVVYDLEFTAWPGSAARHWSGPGEHREIVQIGAVMLEPARGWRAIGSFERVVRPALNPILSSYLIDLTGLTQERLDREAVPLPQALAEFAGWTGPASTPIASFGPDHDVLVENAELNRCPYPFAGRRTLDLRPLILAGFGRPGARISSCDLPKLAGLPSPGRAHDALADAKAVAAALRLLAERGGAAPRDRLLDRPDTDAEAGVADWQFWG